jgi:hypothetical protein
MRGLGGTGFETVHTTDINHAYSYYTWIYLSWNVANL